jgi:hypothetical protein
MTPTRDRRRFLLKTIGGALVAVPWLSGCGEGGPSSENAAPAAAGTPINRGPAAAPKQKKGAAGGARPRGAR